MKQSKRLICCVIALAILLCMAGCGADDSVDNSKEATSAVASETPVILDESYVPDETSPPVETAEQEEPEEAEPGLEFPYELDNGKLLVASLFQSSIMNPDCGLEDDEDIATLEIVNQSSECLTLGSFEAIMSDGSVLHFSATDIPAGAKVWAFETSNQSIEIVESCISLTGEFQYEMDSLRIPSTISVEVDGINVTLTNLTDKPVTNLTVYYHDCFEEIFFGGLVYSYTVDEIPAGETKTIEANDCFLGDAEVVRVTMESDS